MPEKKDDKPIKYYLHEGLNDDDDKLVKEDADALWGRLAKEAEKNKAAREKQHQHRRQKSPEPVSNRGGGSSAPAIAAVAAAATASGGDQQRRRQKSPEPVSNRGSSSAAAAIAPVAAATTGDAGSKVPERKNSRQASIPVVEAISSTSKPVLASAATTNGGGAAGSKLPERKNSRQASIPVVEANSSSSKPAPTVNPTRPVLDQSQRRPSGTSYPTPTGVPVSPTSTSNPSVEVKGPPKRTNTMSSVTANPAVSSSTSPTPVTVPVAKKSIFPGLPRTLSSKSKKWFVDSTLSAKVIFSQSDCVGV